MAGFNVSSMLTTANAKLAGAATLAVMLALNMTASQSKVVQGGAAFAAAMVAVALVK